MLNSKFLGNSNNFSKEKVKASNIYIDLEAKLTKICLDLSASLECNKYLEENLVETKRNLINVLVGLKLQIFLLV